MTPDLSQARTRSRSLQPWLLVTLVLAVVQGCGGGGEQSASETPPEAIDSCTLVTAAEAANALGAATAEAQRPAEANIPPRLATCRYVAQRGQAVAVLTVMVRQGYSDSEASLGFQSAREQFPNAEAVQGIGEQAFAIGNQLNILQGTTYLAISGDIDLMTAQSLAENALERL